MTLPSTHGLARKLEKISKALRELPDQDLDSLLQHLREPRPGQERKRKPKAARILNLPVADPRLMGREELQAYLRNPENFPRKADLLVFARLYEVPSNIRTSREEIVRLCLRMLYDIPRGFSFLRLLSEQQEPAPVKSTRRFFH